MEFNSQRGEMLLFLTTNMAAVQTSNRRSYCMGNLTRWGVGVGLGCTQTFLTSLTCFSIPNFVISSNMIQILNNRS